VLVVEPVAAKRVDELALERQAALLVKGRVLRLRVDADGAAALAPLTLRELEDLVERRDLEPPVVLGRALERERLHGSERLDLLEREVEREPTILQATIDVHAGAPAARELGPALDVGGRRQVRLVAGDQVSVLGGHQVRFDVVRAHLDRPLVALERVVWQVPGRAAMAGDQRPVVALVGRRRVVGGRRRRGHEPACGHDGEHGNGATQAMQGRPPEHGNGSDRP
jgi:hypothetical protein